jgi:hypothetical protein
VIQSTPINSAFTIIITKKINIEGYILKEFSTERAARLYKL